MTERAGFVTLRYTPTGTLIDVHPAFAYYLLATNLHYEAVQ